MAEAPGFAERILACIELIPSGRVMTYGDVAEFVGTRSARVVGRVLAQDHGTVPWHRVLRADGSLAEHGRFVDFDILGHVNNAVYWAIIEEEIAAQRERGRKRPGHTSACTRAVDADGSQNARQQDREPGEHDPRSETGHKALDQ